MIEVHAFATPNSVKVVIALEELGLAYDLKPVNVRAGEQKAQAFLALNANGKVPVLVDDGFVLTESAAILVHLAEKYGSLMPADGPDRARVFEQLFFHASAFYLAARFLSAVTGRGEIRRGDLWKTDVSQEDVVYAFLSPAPMAALWQKLSTEMKPGSLFVSNSFAVPDVDPEEIWELSDSRKTRLFLYPIGKAEKGAEAE